jgi:DNA-binding transcriptional MerR regulator
MKKNSYTIGELSELTGFPLRTIRYYVQEGLLDPPAGRGRGGFYFDSHLERLRLIRSLRDTGMGLVAIAAYLKRGEGKPQATEERELWVRYEIMPGLEISVRRDLEERAPRKVSQIIRTARSVAREEDPNDAK